MARPTIDNIWASSGTATDPAGTKVVDGWAAEIPPFETQNFWQKRVDEMLEDIEQNGVMTWLPATVYKLGAWAKGSDNEIYKSITASNSGNDPIGSPANWTDFTTLLTVIQATETAKGIAEIATLAETQAGTDDTRIVTPKKLKDAILSVVPDATVSAKGKVELSTNAESQTGTDATRAVTPASLKSVTSTETRAGLVERATDAETVTGTDTTRFVTPKQLKDRVNALVPDASETVKGKVERATNTEAATGTDTTRFITPGQVTSRVNVLVPAASETVAGKVERLTDGEAITGTDTTRYVNAKQLKDRINALVPVASTTAQGKVERATDSEASTGTDTTRYITAKHLKDKIDALPSSGADTSLSNLTVAGHDKTITAWVSVDSTGTTAIDDGAGISSVTDFAAGKYQLNFTSAFANNLYGFGGAVTSNASVVLVRPILGAEKTTTHLVVGTMNALSGFVDFGNELYVCIFGGK